MNIKPSGLHSMWHGQTEANFRESFRVAREAARREGVTVVMFFDEVDSSGAMRGTSAATSSSSRPPTESTSWTRP